MIESIFELPSQVTSSLSAADCEKWRDVYNQCDPHSEEDVKKAKKAAWKACKDLPSSFSFEIVASTETIDKSKEIIDLDSIKKTLDSFIDYGGNVQLDHRNYTVGTIWDWKPATIETEEGKVPGVVAYGNLFGGDFVYDTVRKHFVNGMNSLSIGGEATHGNYQCDDKGCYTKKDLKQLMEISVCTEPMNKYSKMIWYNKGASLTKSASATNFRLQQYSIHKDETNCPLLSLRKSLRSIGYDAHAKIDGVHIAMPEDEYIQTKPLFKSHGIVSCYNNGQAVLSWIEDAESIMR